MTAPRVQTGRTRRSEAKAAKLTVTGERYRESIPVNYWDPAQIPPVLRAASCAQHRIYFRWPNAAALGTGFGDGTLLSRLASSLGAAPAGALSLNDSETVRASGLAAVLSDHLDVRDIELMNVAQIVLLAGARVAIGVQGGIATLGSAVGGRMLILCRGGSECIDGANHDFRWHPALANGSIATVGSAADAVRMLQWTCQASTYVHALGSAMGNPELASKPRSRPRPGLLSRARSHLG